MGSRKTVDGVENVYGAADRWVVSALRRDDSLFTPGKPIWSAGWLAELRNRFLDRPEVGDGDFLSKLSSQLEGSPPEVYQLMGEVLYAHFLIIWKEGMGAEAKKDRIEQVLSWGAPVLSIPADLIDGLTPGIARSQALMVQRPYQVAFIIEFVEQWKEEAVNLRERLLSDPWAFKDFVSQLPFRSRLLGDSPNLPGAQREALMHLVHPDGFEGTISVGQKDEIASAKAFAHYITEETPDVDRRLRQIRFGLESGLGRDFDFYDRDIRDWWDTSPLGLWDRYIEIASRFHDSGLMWSHELKYKLEIGEKLRTAREAVHNGTDDWADLVKKGITGNLVHRITLAKFKDWLKDFPEEALSALKTLWTQDDVSDSERIRAFCDGFPSSAISGAGTRMNVISQLLMGLDPEKYPPYRVTTFDNAYRLAGYAQRPDDADEAAQYEHALGFLDRFIEEARSRGLPVRHRLDAQSLVWQVPLQSPEPSDVEVPYAAAMDLSTLSESLRLSEEFLRNIETLLYDKRQVIFQGPPGTGKTYVAQALAEHLAGPEGSTTLIQFHPSYAYEDFVQGFRPKVIDGQPGFELRDGPLLQAAERAREEPDEHHFLVVDEINRGNLAKVFGELYYLLEYRDKEMRLQYSDELFSLPENLHILGTMNTSDRSIALVDLALRRRFYFVEFHPDDAPVKDVLRRWLRDKAPDMEWVANVVSKANEKLSDDRHAAIGPSYFMKDGLDDEAVGRIWKHSVLPYIQERLFGDEERAGDFELDGLRREAESNESVPGDVEMEDSRETQNVPSQ